MSPGESGSGKTTLRRVCLGLQPPTCGEMRFGGEPFGWEPRFIVFHEAVSALDVSVQAQVLNLVRDLQMQHDFGASSSLTIWPRRAICVIALW